LSSPLGSLVNVSASTSSFCQDLAEQLRNWSLLAM
jgi:hypothetical protein